MSEINVSRNELMNILDACYSKCLNGIPKVSMNVDEMALDYLNKYNKAEDACKAMIRNQIIKCSTSGFITGLGGLITLPVAVPANLSSVLYVQMRMIACIAYMAGYDLKNDQTKTFVYACLAGVSINGILKSVGIKTTEKLTIKMINKMPIAVIKKINKTLGYKFMTKYGQKGTINLIKLVPVAGGVVSGGFDLVETKIIAKRAYNWFFENNFISEEELEEA